MNMKPRKPIPKPKQKQVEVDLKSAETMKCAQCDNTIFIQGYVIKKISAIMSPTGEEVIGTSSSVQLWKLWYNLTIIQGTR